MAQMVKNPFAMQETSVQSLDWEDSPGEGNGKSLQYSCLENSMHGQRSLAGYSPWGHKESDTTNTFTFFLLIEVWENWVSLLAGRISAKHGQ